MLATGGYDGTVIVWQTDARTRLAGPFNHSRWVTDVAFCEHGDCVAATGFEHPIKVWEISSGKQINQIATGNYCFALDADCANRRLLVATLQGHSCIQALSTRGCVLKGIQSFKPDNNNESHVMDHFNRVTAAKYGQHGALIVTGCDDRFVRIWDSAAGKLGPALRTRDQVTSVAFNPTVGCFAAACIDGSVRIWGLPPPNMFGAFRHPAGISDVCFTSDGNQLLVVGKDRNGGNAPRIWDVRKGEPANGREFPRYFYIGGASFDRTGDNIVIADEMSVKWLNVKSGTEVASRDGHTRRIQKLVKHPDGSCFATGDEAGHALIWNFESHQLLADINFEGHSRAITFARQGALFVTGAKGDSVQAWKLDGARRGSPLNVGVVASALASSFQGNVVAVGGTDGSVRLWDLDTRKTVGRPMSHMSEVTDIGFSLDGSLLATCALDRTCRLWEPLTGKAVGPPLQSEAIVWALDWNPDGRSIVAAGTESVARLWRKPFRLSGTAGDLDKFSQHITGMSMDRDGAANILTSRDRPTAPQQKIIYASENMQAN
jgi:WD40 repeat protein